MRRKEHGTGFDLHAIEVFYRVLETGSFSEAARAMGLAQPTVSQHVASLEKALSVKLLDRSTKKVRPTPGGKVLRDYARKLLALRDQAAEAVALADGAIQGVLRVGASTIPGTYVVPEAAAAFRYAHPHVAVEVEIGDSRSVEAMVAEEHVELGLTGTAPADRRVRGTPFLKDELILTLPPDDPWCGARGKTVSPKDLRDATS